MADGQDHIQRDLPNYPYAPPPRRRSLPRRSNTDVKHYEPSVKYGSSHHPNKTHRRFSSVLNASDPILGPGDPNTAAPNLTEEPGEIQPGTGFIAEDPDQYDTALEDESIVQTPSVASTGLATVSPSSRGSSASGASISTVTEAPFMNKDNTGKTTVKRKKIPGKKPNAFNFLDSDSPIITAESIRRSMEEASRRSPNSLQGQSPSTRSTSTVSNGFRDDTSENMGEHETDRSTSPERGPEIPHENHPPPNIGPRRPAAQNRKRSYEFPEGPRGTPEHQHIPHIPPSDHMLRDPNRGRPPPPPPRPERLPLTGYQLLASRISTSSSNHAEPALRPIYRRFETLNHRLLLYLQDEICELEEQLHRLDAADTQARRLPNCFFPASRRAECMAGGELHWHKTDLLGKIAFKLEQYNRILSSFRETQRMPAPILEDVHEYRSYLATQSPIAEVETRFLDAVDDLVCVSDEYQDVVEEEAIATPMPMPMPHPEFAMPEPRAISPIRSRPVSPYRQQETGTETVISVYEETPIIPLSIAVTVAVILPILTFLIIPGYPGRLTVVFLVGLSILGALIQGHIVAVRTWELLTVGGLYGAVMAVIAGIV
ncbi:hypothetical protein GGS26DRAFT_97612 [Hypomontagnella submonticulosa]|nr:hypothetical protein GGS26DRAFT_97612 [Hypomontagnella submonticulosa]